MLGWEVFGSLMKRERRARVVTDVIGETEIYYRECLTSYESNRLEFYILNDVEGVQDCAPAKPLTRPFYFPCPVFWWHSPKLCRFASTRYLLPQYVTCHAAKVRLSCGIYKGITLAYSDHVSFQRFILPYFPPQVDLFWETLCI